MSPPLHIGVLTGRVAYPNGMAGAQRIHLMARAMAAAGAMVNVWVDGQDSATEVRNLNAIGTKDGIPYEHLLGRTQASRYKLRRVCDRIALALATRRRMAAAVHSQSLDGLYFYTPCSDFDFERFVVRNIARKTNLPVVLDLREAPWTLKQKPSLVEKMASPLFGADGVICISRFLKDWVHQENKRTAKNVRTLYVPILVDINEIALAESTPPQKVVLFAGSPGYDETFRFLLSVMEKVWAKHADCQLVITGGTTEATFGAAAKSQNKKIRYAGFVDRPALLREYTAASVLAIPLFDDIRSQARFPTKLGEYLASGRPVVTNRVGEIPHFLEAGVSACITEPGDIPAYAEAICRLLGNPTIGHAMGRAGRQVALKEFHYANYGAQLCDFFVKQLHPK